MGRALHKLTSKGVEAKREPGYYGDGGNLWLQVSPSTSKSWIFRYTLNGKQREMGMGSLADVSLADARITAGKYRLLVRDKIDPIDARTDENRQLKLAAANTMSFRKCFQAYIEAHKKEWKNPKHVDQWTNTLETYCGPIFGDDPAQRVDTPQIMRVLEPIWTTKTETANRLRGRIEKVLDWATVRGYRTGANPARWRGHLKELLASPRKIQTVKHHPALAFDRMGDFMKKLRAQEGGAARALELLILTTLRTNEVIGGKSAEFDFESAAWTVPGTRMKAKKLHRVPLVPRAIELVKEALKQGGTYLFPGAKPKSHLSNMAMLALLDRMGYSHITVHGFRSSFRDWASERTNYAPELCEMALAHAIKDKTEAAYRRGELFEKRRRLMLDWARHCDTVKPAGKVISLRAKRKSA